MNEGRKGFFYTDEEGRVRFAGGPSSGGGGIRRVSAFYQAAIAGNIDVEEYLGGGITDADLMEYSDDGKGVWKKVDVGHGFHDGNAEVAAYRLNQLLGGDEVPETVYAPNRGGERGTSQAFIEGAREVRMADIQSMPIDARDRVVAMDVISGQGDRHWGNAVVGPDGKVWAIDNGHASWYDQRNPDNLAYVMGASCVASSTASHALDWTSSYQIGAPTMAKLRSITRDEYNKIFDGIELYDGNKRRVNPDMGWSNLQMILEREGKLEW